MGFQLCVYQPCCAISYKATVYLYCDMARYRGDLPATPRVPHTEKENKELQDTRRTMCVFVCVHDSAVYPRALGVVSGFCPWTTVLLKTYKIPYFSVWSPSISTHFDQHSASFLTHRELVHREKKRNKALLCLLNVFQGPPSPPAPNVKPNLVSASRGKMETLRSSSQRWTLFNPNVRSYTTLNRLNPSKNSE